MKKKTKILLTIILPFSLIMFFFIIPLTIAEIINSVIFGKRCNVKEPFILDVSDYPNLKCEEVEFKSSGNKLQGYLYSSDTLTPKGVVVYAHGFDCGGSNSTMMFADYFVSNDYYYFTYDATANGKSKGDDQKGLIQGVKDLNKAISYVKDNDKLKDYPIMLLGHSWGAYSVCSALKMHPDVKCIVSMSGFDNANDLMINSATKYVGSFLATLSAPYLKLYERMIFGSDTALSSTKGLENSECKAFIIHSSDDKTIDINFGYNRYYDKFKDDARFKFKLYNNRGHGYIFLKDEARIMIENYLENKGEFNKDLYINGLDLDLFNEILEMFNNSL
ncbi:MAG: alpha/beta hydrolase [Acholeplasmatales bacterium]|nr:alpha/beta hydrolase [Acholeplasmatales bacterium]